MSGVIKERRNNFARCRSCYHLRRRNTGKRELSLLETKYKGRILDGRNKTRIKDRKEENGTLKALENVI